MSKTHYTAEKKTVEVLIPEISDCWYLGGNSLTQLSIVSPHGEITYIDICTSGLYYARDLNYKNVQLGKMRARRRRRLLNRTKAIHNRNWYGYSPVDVDQVTVSTHRKLRNLGTKKPMPFGKTVSTFTQVLTALANQTTFSNR